MNTLKACVSIALATLLLSTFSVSASVWAEQELDSLKEPLTLQIQTDLDGKTVAEGDVFKAVLSETYVYEKLTLPAGTQFEGTIIKSKTSKHLARPGYVVMDIMKATLPNGVSLTFDQYKSRNKHVVHKDANTKKRVFYNGLPFFVVNAATTLPLRLLTTVPGAPIGFASKMALGVAKEYYRKDKDKSRPNGHKIGYGVLVGSSLPGIMFTGAKRPEPNFKAGENVDVYLDPDGLQRLFEAGSR